MKRPNVLKRRNLLACVALLAKCHNVVAATVTTSPQTNAAAQTYGTDVQIPFATTVANADQLLSISGGSVHGAEGESFSIEVDFQTGSPETIYTSANGFFNENLSAVPAEPITLPTPGDLITGIEIVSGGGSGNTPLDIQVPANTFFTFDTVTATTPEPSTLTMLGTPLLAASALAWKRRRRPASV